jgi:hypothetical protein
LLQEAITASKADPDTCTLVGGHLTNIDAARQAGTHSIGCVNKPGKAEPSPTPTQAPSSPVSPRSTSHYEHDHCRIKPFIDQAASSARSAPGPASSRPAQADGGCARFSPLRQAKLMISDEKEPAKWRLLVHLSEIVRKLFLIVPKSCCPLGQYTTAPASEAIPRTQDVLPAVRTAEGMTRINVLISIEQ